jgi:hypothetical protein
MQRVLSEASDRHALEARALAYAQAHSFARVAETYLEALELG